MNQLKKRRDMKQVIVSLLALLNVMFVPLYDVWGGLFPGDVDETFWDVITGQCETNAWVFVFTIAVFVPTAFMLIFSLAKARRLARLSGAVGLVWMVIDLIRYVNQYEIGYLFEFEDGNFSIGIWIALVLFLVMTLIATPKLMKEAPKAEPVPEIANI